VTPPPLHASQNTQQQFIVSLYFSNYLKTLKLLAIYICCNTSFSTNKSCAVVRMVRGQAPDVTSSIRDMTILKTTQSGFEDYLLPVSVCVCVFIYHACMREMIHIHTCTSDSPSHHHHWWQVNIFHCCFIHRLNLNQNILLLCYSRRTKTSTRSYLKVMIGAYPPD
jgi:hypothetical protein